MIDESKIGIGEGWGISDKPKTWGEMTDVEKGALLLAQHNGKKIQCEQQPDGDWLTIPECRFNSDKARYRIKPEPVVETVTVYGKGSSLWVFSSAEGCASDTHTISFNTIDGEPDCSSIIMKKL